MSQQVQFGGSEIRYARIGSGDALVFLHGYLESSEIWGEFTQRFVENYTVITVDIPGHGGSGILGEIHGMDLMAEAVLHVLNTEGIKEKVTVVGHSMGGYVTMEFVDRFPERTNGYVLFHSTCFADTEEKKLNRDREISLVKCGKKGQIVRTNIPKGFSDDHLEAMKSEIERCKSIALATPDEGIIALLRGMQERKDHSGLLSDSRFTPMIVWGKKDNYIGREAVEKMMKLAPNAMLLPLEVSGHMGFLEEPESAYYGIKSYLERHQ